MYRSGFGGGVAVAVAVFGHRSNHSAEHQAAIRICSNHVVDVLRN